MMNLDIDQVQKVFPDVEKRDYLEHAKGSRDSSSTVTRRVLRWGIESRGIQPVPVEERVDRQYHKLFFIWFSANANILSFSAGALGPVFGLGLRDACLVILFFNLVCTIFPAYLSTWGPKLGLRQMVQARYSFGYYGVIVPCILNLIGMTGFCILNCILGGQTLSSVADGRLSWSVGIVITAVISLFLSFCGYNVLSWYEKVAWAPVLLVYIIALGVSGHRLSAPPPPEPANASSVLGYGATIAGFVITWSGLASDYTSYFRSEVPRVKIFLYTYFGLLLPTVTLQCLGVACTIAAAGIPTWEDGLDNGNVGGLLGAMLEPTGNFGKFLTVLLALSVIGNIAMTFYSFCLNIQLFLPTLVLVPRYVFSIVITAIVIPIAIVGSHRFYETLANFLGLIGYWASAFVIIVISEHYIFRHGRPQRYNVNNWNTPSRLPLGAAALGAGAAGFGVAVLCMDQVWFTGPVARKTGDIGFMVAFVVALMLYTPLRALEVRWWGDLEK